jgi:hypothetical protein
VKWLGTTWRALGPRGPVFLVIVASVATGLAFLYSFAQGRLRGLPDVPFGALWLIVFLGLLWLSVARYARALELELEPKLIVLKPTTESAVTDTSHRGFYYHFIVENPTSALVRDCEAQLERIVRTTEEGQTAEGDFGGPIPLKVSRNMQQTRVDVPSKLQRRFDFIVSTEIGNWFGLARELVRPVAFAESFFAPSGTYDFTVAVTGQNVPTVRATVRAVWKNDWQQVDVTLLE